MADRKHSANRQRQHMIGVRVTEAEFAALAAAAEAEGTSIPDLLRTLGLQKAGVECSYRPRAGVPESVTRLAETNAGRSRLAAQRDVAVAARALDTAPHPGWPPLWGAVALARVDLPDATLAEVGARIGVSKHSAASAMRRLRAAVAAMENGDG